jgi:hypothetical protein
LFSELLLQHFFGSFMHFQLEPSVFLLAKSKFLIESADLVGFGVQLLGFLDISGTRPNLSFRASTLPTPLRLLQLLINVGLSNLGANIRQTTPTLAWRKDRFR